MFSIFTYVGHTVSLVYLRFYFNWIALADILPANGDELNLIPKKSARPLYFTFLSLSGLFGPGINKYC